MPGTGLLPAPGQQPHSVHPWSFGLWGACKLMLPWFALVLTLASLAMLNWFVVTELRTMREGMRGMYIDLARNQQHILVNQERIVARLERIERDTSGMDR